MKENKFLDGMSNLDSEVVETFVVMDNKLQNNINKRKPKNLWLRVGVIAASFAVILCVVLIAFQVYKSNNGDPSKPPIIGDATDRVEDESKTDTDDTETKTPNDTSVGILPSTSNGSETLELTETEEYSESETLTETEADTETETATETATERATETEIETESQTYTETQTETEGFITSITDESEEILESNTEEDSSNLTQNNGYQIIEVEDGYRLVFDDPSVYESNPPMGQMSVGFEVDSLETFLNDLISGDLSYNQKLRIFYTWEPKDEYGIILCDPYNIYEPTHSFLYEISSKALHSGGMYARELTFKNPYDCSALCAVLSKYSYDLNYNRFFATIDSQEKNIEYEKEISDGSTMICYNKTVETEYNSSIVRYILSNGMKTIFVEKIYGGSEDFKKLYDIKLLGVIDNDKYFEVGSIINNTSEDLSDEFLFGFGIELVESDTETETETVTETNTETETDFPLETSDSIIDYQLLTLSSEDEYNEFLNSNELLADFVPYDKINAIGDFEGLVILSNAYSNDYSSYMYSLVDSEGFEFVLYIDHKERESYLTDSVSNVNTMDMRALSDDSKGFYVYNDITYEYISGKLLSIVWEDQNIIYTLSGDTMLFEYPLTDSTFIGKMLNTDTALQAFNDVFN